MVPSLDVIDSRSSKRDDDDPPHDHDDDPVDVIISIAPLYLYTVSELYLSQELRRDSVSLVINLAVQW